jgi:predicted HTH transcriptional regulator
MSENIGVSTTAIDKKMAALKRKGIIERVGSDTKETWKIKIPDEK